MKLRSFLRLITAPALVIVLALQTAIAAGFHYQLDLTAKLVNNPENELTAIQMSWIYDKELSAILMDGEDLSEENLEASLEKRTEEILSGLIDVKYFTTLVLDQKPLEFLAASHYKLRLTKESRLQMNLTLPIKNKEQIKGRTLEIVVTDDSAVGLATFVDTSHMLLDDYYTTSCKAPALVQKKLAEIDGHAQVLETMTLDCR